MRVSIQKPLFPWDELEDHPALATINELLATIPGIEFCRSWWSRTGYSAQLIAQQDLAELRCTGEDVCHKFWSRNNL